jgi:hypothetical protein
LLFFYLRKEGSMLNALKGALCVVLVGVSVSLVAVPTFAGDGEKPGDPTMPAPPLPPPPDTIGG